MKLRLLYSENGRDVHMFMFMYMRLLQLLHVYARVRVLH